MASTHLGYRHAGVLRRPRRLLLRPLFQAKPGHVVQQLPRLGTGRRKCPPRPPPRHAVAEHSGMVLLKRNDLELLGHVRARGFVIIPLNCESLAPAIGLEPITCRLTAGRSAD